MFQLSEKQSDKIIDYIPILIIAIGLCSIVFLFYITFGIDLDPYNDACWQIKEHFAELSISNCIDYLNDNNGATGQDVINNQNIVTIDQVLANPVNDLLEKPIIPVK